MASSNKIIGIDLGTTNSAIAVMQGGKATVIPTAEGRNTFPSIVGFKGDNVIVGDPAKRQMVLNPKRTINSVKRFMGRKFKDKEVEAAMKHVAYEISEGKDGMAVVTIEGKKYTPQEISAKILSKAKADAEAFLGGTVEKAVITVISMTHNVRQPNKLEKSQASQSSVLSTSQPLLHSRTVWTRKIMRSSRSTTLVVEPSTFLSWKLVTESSKSNQPMVIRSSVEMTLIT
jgi:hypothetical protein